MTLRKHFAKLLMEIMMATGLVWLMMIVYGTLAGMTTFSITLMTGLLLLCMTVILRFSSWINFHNLEEHQLRLNYFICSFAADISLIILFLYFTSGGKAYQDKGIHILILYFVLKTLVYVMIYIQGFHDAKKINDKLNMLNQ